MEKLTSTNAVLFEMSSLHNLTIINALVKIPNCIFNKIYSDLPNLNRILSQRSLKFCSLVRNTRSVQKEKLIEKDQAIEKAKFPYLSKKKEVERDFNKM